MNERAPPPPLPPRAAAPTSAPVAPALPPRLSTSAPTPTHPQTPLSLSALTMPTVLFAAILALLAYARLSVWLIFLVAGLGVAAVWQSEQEAEMQKEAVRKLDEVAHVSGEVGISPRTPRTHITSP